MLSRIIPLVFLFLAAYARADITDLDPARFHVWRENDKLKVAEKHADGSETLVQTYDLELIPQGKKFTHWTTPENRDRWNSQGGYIDQGEIQYLSTPSGDRQVHGPGWYVSASPIDSDSFGVAVEQAESPGNHWVVKADIKPTTPEMAQRTFDQLRNQGVLGSKVTDTWYTYFDKWPASHLSRGTPAKAMDALMALQPPPTDLQTLLEVADRYGLEPHPYLTTNHPLIDKVLRGQPLADAERDTLVRTYFTTLRPKDGLESTVLAKLPESDRVQVINQSLAQSNPAQKLDALLNLDQTSNLPAPNVVGQHSPELGKLLSGQSLSAPERASFFQTLSRTQTFANTPIFREFHDTPLILKLRQELQPEIRNYFKTTVANARGYASGLASTISQARGWGVPLTEMDPAAQEPGITAKPGHIIDFQRARAEISPYGRNLLDSFAYIDHADILKAAANEQGNPWTMYDNDGNRPLKEAWNETISKTFNSHPERVSNLVGHPVDYRDHPVVAGGDIHAPGSNDGWFRVTEDRLHDLQGHPLLSVTSMPDPWPQTQARKSFLVRYEYPSARTYLKFVDKLPADLQAQLRAADAAGQLADAGSPQFRDLTKKILASLLTQVDSQSNKPIDKYIQRIGIHPWEDDNGRYTRNLYNQEAGRPLVLRPWDYDLLTSPSEVAAARDEGDAAINAIATGLLRAYRENPNDPKYYNSPELYHTFFHSPTPPPPGQEDAYFQAERGFFRDPTHMGMIQHKEYEDLDAQAWDFEVNRLLGLPEDQRRANIQAWASTNQRPVPRTAALYQSLLDASKQAATSDPQGTMIRWWADLATDPEVAYRTNLEGFLNGLPTDLKNAFAAEWATRAASAAHPFGPNFLSPPPDAAATSAAGAAANCGPAFAGVAPH